MSVAEAIAAQAAEIAQLQDSVGAIREAHAAVLRLLPRDDSVEPVLKADHLENLAAAARAVASMRAQQARAVERFRDEIALLRAEVAAGAARILAAVDGRAPPLAGLAFPLRAGAPLDGVIAGLTALGGANAHDCGLVEVIASGCYDEGRFAPKAVADLTADSVFVSRDAPMQWVGYRFRQARLRFRHYALRSRFDGWVNSNNPRAWVLECSLDGERWREVDRRTGNGELNATGVTRVFALEREALAEYVRVRQIEPAHSGKNFLALSAFELFGTFVE
jgi:hypothetical protein